MSPVTRRGFGARFSCMTTYPAALLREKNAGLDDVDTHAAGRAFDRVHGGFKIEAVEIGHLDFRDLFDLLHGDLADFGLVRLRRALGEADGAFNKYRDRRRLCDEREGTVGVHGDNGRYNQAFLILARRLGVERLAELHDVDALRTESGTDGGSRRSLASRNLELYLCLNFLSHFNPN